MKVHEAVDLATLARGASKLPKPWVEAISATIIISVRVIIPIIIVVTIIIAIGIIIVIILITAISNQV